MNGLLLVTMEPTAAMQEEFNDWYDQEHIPERIALPGFLSATRWVCLQGWPRYLAGIRPGVGRGHGIARIHRRRRAERQPMEPPCAAAHDRAPPGGRDAGEPGSGHRGHGTGSRYAGRGAVSRRLAPPRCWT